MSDKFTPRVGAIFSADIAVENQPEISAFYDKVLGTGDAPLWNPGGVSSLGFPILGVGSATGEYAHFPRQWCIHVQVADVAASVQRAKELGGTLIQEGRSEGGVAQWAVIQDPAGALVGLVPISG